MAKYRIRPHHGMCLAFFEGKGYSDGFTKHMGEMKLALEKNPKVILEEKTDDICVACPHNKEGLCEAFEKVSRYDAGVLKKCGLNTGLESSFLEFERLVSEKILLAGKGREICGDCQWAYICHK